MKGKYPNNLQRILDEAGMSMAELARRADTSRQNIQRWADAERKLTAPIAAKLAPILETTPERLMFPEPLAPIVGSVGADPTGAVLHALGDQSTDFAPIPLGGSSRSVAVEVRGHSMRPVAEDGALIYYEDRRDPPTEDLLGQVVIVGVDTGEVMVKRLLRGSLPGTYDLESINGETRRDVRIEWAARIAFVVAPWKARQIIRRG